MNTIANDHPLRKSEWIWPDFYMYLHNHFAQFRWDFELPGGGRDARVTDGAVAGKVPFYITADKGYRLYVNGEHVCRGPARGYQSHWPADEVDIARYLRAGKNWIAVEGYNPGCSTFQYLHMTSAGLLVATGDEKLRAAMKAGRFAMRRGPGHRRNTARYSYQIDFQEHVDLRLDDRGWITSEVPPEGWVAEIFPPETMKMNTIPFGRAPYEDVEERGIPLMREEMVVPGLPTSCGAGVCGAGYEGAENVSWFWIEEMKGVKAWAAASSLGGHVEGGALTMTLPATGKGKFLAVVIPAGEMLVGSLEVVVEGASGGEILDFQHDQMFRDGVPHHVRPGDGCVIALGNRMILRGGTNRHEFFHPLGFGVVTMIARDVEKPITVKLRIRKVGYPFTMTGVFESSDAVLNGIHAACKRTQQMCALDAYVDTPWREQAQWWGDARVQAANTFYLDGDARLLARGIRSLAGQSVRGLTLGHAPTSSYWCVLPDFALTWILTLWDHYWQTGDVELFVEQRGRVAEVLAYFDTEQARDEGGLLKFDAKFWLFEDWAELPKDRIPTFLNLWYLLTLRHLTRLSEVAGLDKEAEAYRRRAVDHEELVMTKLFDGKRGVFVPALDATLRPYGEPSVHDQTLALMMEMAEEHAAGMLEKFVLPYLRGEKLAGPTPSAFWATYTIGEAIRRGYAKEAVAFIKKKWEPMLSTGTTWEGFDWKEEAGGSACHAWTAHPAFHFVNALAGITQVAAGWEAVRFEPCFAVDKVHAVVPTPRGRIEVVWEKVGGKVRGTLKLPADVRARVRLPGIRKEVGGTFEFEVDATAD